MGADDMQMALSLSPSTSSYISLSLSLSLSLYLYLCLSSYLQRAKRPGRILIDHRLVLDEFGARREFERRQRFAKVDFGRRHVGDDVGHRVAAERIFEQKRELGVAIVDMPVGVCGVLRADIF